MSDLAQLLPVSKAQFSGEEQLCVNMRNVHTALGVGKMYAHWIQDRIMKYGFEKGSDYEVFAEIGKNPECGGRPRNEYYFTLDAAKEIAMVENNEKGSDYEVFAEIGENSTADALPNFGEPIGAGDIECMSSGEQMPANLLLPGASEMLLPENSQL